MSVPESSQNQLPREKLFDNGVTELTLPELLAVILGTGYKKENVLSLSERIFGDYGPKAIMTCTTVQEVMEEYQLPPVKSAQILACFEIGRRMYQSDESDKPRLSSPEDVWQYTADMHRLNKEHLRGLYLNTKHQIVHDELISIGTLDQSIAHPRDIYKPALVHSAASLILIHNHPSGDLTPSQADQQLTQQVAEVGRLMCVPLLDHIIVSWKGYKSLI